MTFFNKASQPLLRWHLFCCFLLLSFVALTTYGSDTQASEYPCKVSNNLCGKCVVATQDIAVGKIVEQFVGRKVKYEEVPSEEICYVACRGDGYWIIPTTNARYINHSCDPNCNINSKGDIYAIRFIKAGEEITFDYVTISRERYLQAPQEYFWDSRWSFDCLCGSINCYKRIDHYIIKD